MTNRYEDEPTYRCLECRDEGVVFIWNQKTVKRLLAEEPVVANHATARCCCELGTKRFSGLPLHNPAKQCRVGLAGNFHGRSVDDMRADVAVWVNTRNNFDPSAWGDEF